VILLRLPLRKKTQQEFQTAQATTVNLTCALQYIVRHCTILVLPPVCGLFSATHNETCDNSRAAMKTGLCRPMRREENNPLFYFPLTPEKI
jgi:hypothetical protein